MAGYYPVTHQCIPAAASCAPAPACIPPQILTCLLQDKDLGSGEQAKSINDVIVKIDKLCAALQNIKCELMNLSRGNGNGNGQDDCDPDCPGGRNDGMNDYYGEGIQC